MIIRNEQMAQIERAQQNNFHQLVVDFLKKEMPDIVASIPRERLDRVINNAKQRAAQYGIDEPVPLTQFICITVAAGEGFDQQADINLYLKDTSLDQTEKMQALIDQIEAAED